MNGGYCPSAWLGEEAYCFQYGIGKVVAYLLRIPNCSNSLSVPFSASMLWVAFGGRGLASALGANCETWDKTTHLPF